MWAGHQYLLNVPLVITRKPFVLESQNYQRDNEGFVK